jgi:photosystem II stability/assembly factor-like uncharacterized protein
MTTALDRRKQQRISATETSLSSRPRSRIAVPTKPHPAVEQFSWRPTNAPLAQRYADIWFITPELGWAVNSNGQILHTADGGNNWEVRFQVPPSASSLWLRSVGFATDTRGWVGTTGGEIRLFETSDGGAT